MKLRIQGNSLRLRLTRSEVGTLQMGKAVAESIFFSNGARLSYRLEIGTGPSVAADYSDDELRVSLPEKLAETWFSDNEVSISAELAIDGRPPLSILIEKDFACLIPREGEDQADMFPNPQASN